MEKERPGFHMYPRLATVSDLVFGVALSIGALTLIGQQARDYPHLLIYIIEYGFSFIILFEVWRAYSQLMTVIAIDTLGLLYANVALLFLVTIEPFLYNTLFINIYSEMVNRASILYALDIAGMFLILAFFSHVIVNKKEVTDENELWRFKFRRATFFAVAAIFTISCLPVFWSWKLPAIIITLGDYTRFHHLHFRAIIWLIFSPITVQLFLQWGDKYLRKHRYGSWIEKF